mmetsp:Transcript_22751/g.35628  ORF Transcript_22751/g.35628 Transcript_22751/m.35628 type:complete len:83 (+) Transcript_22751:1110-1358(+)
MVRGSPWWHAHFLGLSLKNSFQPKLPQIPLIVGGSILQSRDERIHCKSRHKFKTDLISQNSAPTRGRMWVCNEDLKETSSHD